MKKLLGFTLAVPLYIYVIGLFIAIPVFNWRYANEHGVVSWIVFGEIVATVKAPFWPYYAITKWTSREDPIISKSDLHFTNAREASNGGLRIIDGAGGIASLSSVQKSQITEILEKVIAEAKQVDDSYLTAVHAELPKTYREQYLDSVTQLAAGLRDGDIFKQTLGALKYNEYSQWMSDHSKELHFPKR